MSVVYFDPNGNLTPYLVSRMHPETFRECFVARFPHSRTRARLYEGYLRHRDGLRQALGCPFRQWVGGSFVTRKAHPSDVDAVCVVPHAPEIEARLLGELERYMTLGGSKETFGVDGFLVLLEGPTGPGLLSHLNHPELEYWQKWLGSDRLGNPKGVIELYVP